MKNKGDINKIMQTSMPLVYGKQRQKPTTVLAVLDNVLLAT